MANINTVNAVYWSPRLGESGEIVTDADDINQCIAIIIQTPKGADPLRPEFGCDILRFIDLPINEARIGIVSEVITALNTWEQRIEIDSVNVEKSGDAEIKITIIWSYVAGEALETAEVVI